MSKQAGMPLRGDRIHRYVNAFCPHCHEERPDRPLAEVRRLSGWLAVRDDRVWLERGCPDHGLVSTLYDESPEILALPRAVDRARRRCTRPTSRGNFKPVPSAYEDGLPEMQTQHTCILLEDITDHCNLRCPTCFAESSPGAGRGRPARGGARVDRHPALARERPHRRADAVAAASRRSTRWLAELLDAVAARPVVRILVNTNGLRIAQDDELLGAADAAPRAGRGLPPVRRARRAEASTHHRGADIRRFKERAIERLSAAGVFTTLTMTAALDVNDDEIGAVVKRALDTPYVGGVTIQPVFGSGRTAGIDPLRPAHAHRGAGAARGADRRRRSPGAT